MVSPQSGMAAGAHNHAAVVAAAVSHGAGSPASRVARSSQPHSCNCGHRGFCALCVFLIDITVRLYPKYARWDLGWRLLVKTVHVCLALLAFPVAGYITLVIAHQALDEGLNTELRDRHGTSFTEVFPGLGYSDTQYYRTHGYFFRTSRPTAT